MFFFFLGFMTYDMHLVSMNLTEKSKLNGFNEHNYVVSKRNPCQIEEKRKKTFSELVHI